MSSRVILFRNAICIFISSTFKIAVHVKSYQTALASWEPSETCFCCLHLFSSIFWQVFLETVPSHWFHYTSNKQTKPSLHPLINNLSQHLSSSAHVREPGRVQSHWSTSKQDLWYTPSIASLPKRIVDISAWCLWTKTRADLITSQWQHMLFFLFERNNFLAICWHKILCYRTIERDTLHQESNLASKSHDSGWPQPSVLIGLLHGT